MSLSSICECVSSLIHSRFYSRSMHFLVFHYLINNENKTQTKKSASLLEMKKGNCTLEGSIYLVLLLIFFYCKSQLINLRLLSKQHRPDLMINKFVSLG